MAHSRRICLARCESPKLLNHVPKFFHGLWVLGIGAVNQRVKQVTPFPVCVQQPIWVTALHKFIPFSRVQAGAIEKALDKVGNFIGCFRLTPVSRFLSSVKYEEEIDHRWHYEGKKKFSGWPLLTEGRVTRDVEGTPHSNNQTNHCKNVCIFREPESSACPKNEKPCRAN